ncbi:MAG: aldehyde dehydrogenase family protein, partial [Gemmatimonadaceae bacterium]
MSISSINPATGETVRSFETFTTARIGETLDRGVTAYRQHRVTSFTARAECMRKAAQILDAECRELGKLMTLE